MTDQPIEPTAAPVEVEQVNTPAPAPGVLVDPPAEPTATPADTGEVPAPAVDAPAPAEAVEPAGAPTWPTVVLVPESMQNLGEHDGTIVDLGDRIGAVDVALAVDAVYGTDPRLDLVVESSATGAEDSWAIAAEFANVTLPGRHERSVELVAETDTEARTRFLRTRFAVAGVGASFYFSLAETP